MSRPTFKYQVMRYSDAFNIMFCSLATGIHGLPFLPWNGAEQVPDGPTAGYCPHGVRLDENLQSSI